MKQIRPLLFNARLLAVLNLGFASGLPLALIGTTTLAAWYTEAHVNLVLIGALSLLGLPYTLKFLWAPLLDYYGIKRLGKRKGWILCMQAALLVALLVLAQLEPSKSSLLIGGLALLIAFFSASQDIAITAYQTEILQEKERGLGVAYYVFAYRVALLIGGGLTLVFADYVGWRSTYQIMAGFLAIAMVFSYFAPKPREVLLPTHNLLRTSKDAFLNLLTRPRALWLLLFIFFYKFGDALALSLMTNFLLQGLHFTLTEVGLAYKSVSFFAMILGGFVGGLFLTRLSIFKALFIFGTAQAFSNLLFVILALSGKQFFLMASTIFVENFCSGLSTASLLAFLMSICDQRYTATQFALLSAIVSLPRVLLGPVASLMVLHLGWVQFYVWSFLWCLPGLVFLLLLKEWVVAYVPITAE